MKKETKTAVYDDELRIEAYRFEGIIQPFPSHFTSYFNQFIGLAPGIYREIFSEKDRDGGQNGE